MSLSYPAGLRRSFRLGRKSSRAREAARRRRWSTGVHGPVRPPTYIEVIPYHRDPKERHRLVILVGTYKLNKEAACHRVQRVCFESTMRW